MLQLSKYVISSQANVIAELLRVEGSLRLYEGTQPPISQRTEGRIVECKISEVTVEGATITVKWDAGTAIKSGQADYFRLCSKNIPVLSGAIGEGMEMEMSDREIKVGSVVDAGMLLHTVFKG